jgi:hypothetical protein
MHDLLHLCSQFYIPYQSLYHYILAQYSTGSGMSNEMQLQIDLGAAYILPYPVIDSPNLALE